jgi:hypothetical protein
VPRGIHAAREEVAADLASLAGARSSAAANRGCAVAATMLKRHAGIRKTHEEPSLRIIGILFRDSRDVLV